MSNTSSCNKDFREWSESIMTRTQELIKKLKETQRDLQWQYDMELHRLESEVKKKEEIKWLKTPKVLPVEKTLNVEMLTPVFDIHAELVRQLSEYRARQIENELIKLPKEFTVKGKIEWIKKPDEEKLEVGKWYDARTFDVATLKKLLPVGTKVFVIKDYTSNSNNAVEFARETWLKTTVQNIDKRTDTEQTRVGITGDIFFRRYFRIVEEN